MHTFNLQLISTSFFHLRSFALSLTLFLHLLYLSLSYTLFPHILSPPSSPFFTSSFLSYFTSLVLSSSLLFSLTSFFSSPCALVSSYTLLPLLFHFLPNSSSFSFSSLFPSPPPPLIPSFSFILSLSSSPSYPNLSSGLLSEWTSGFSASNCIGKYDSVAWGELGGSGKRFEGKE